MRPDAVSLDDRTTLFGRRIFLAGIQALLLRAEDREEERS